MLIGENDLKWWPQTTSDRWSWWCFRLKWRFHLMLWGSVTLHCRQWDVLTSCGVLGLLQQQPVLLIFHLLHLALVLPLQLLHCLSLRVLHGCQAAAAGGLRPTASPCTCAISHATSSTISSSPPTSPSPALKFLELLPQWRHLWSDREVKPTELHWWRDSGLLIELGLTLTLTWTGSCHLWTSLWCLKMIHNWISIHDHRCGST